MKGDWVKMRTDLFRDPRVIRMADIIYQGQSGANINHDDVTLRNKSVTMRNVLRNAVVGALVTVWGGARLRGERKNDDLILHQATIQTLDVMTEFDGIGAAMLDVKWVEVSEGNSLIFSNFFTENNSDPDADYRSKNAERQARHRQKLKRENSNASVTLSNNVTVTSRRNTEKSREETYIYVARNELLALGVSDDLIRDWLIIRGKKKLTKTSLDATTREAEKAGISLEQAIRICCERGWVGFMARYLQGDQQQSSKGRNVWENQP